MAASNLARCSGGIFASASGVSGMPLIRVVVVISQAPGLALKESASARDAMSGMIGPGVSPRTIVSRKSPSAHVILVMFVPSLTGCGKTMLARENFDGPHVCLRRAQSSGTTGEHSRRRLKKAAFLPAQP